MTRTRKKATPQEWAARNGTVGPEATLTTLKLAPGADAGSPAITFAVDAASPAVGGAAAADAAVLSGVAPTSPPVAGTSAPPASSSSSSPAAAATAVASRPYLGIHGGGRDQDRDGQPGGDRTDGADVAQAQVPVQPGIGGLAFTVGGVRRVIGDPGWARVLRRFSRVAVWMLPFAAGCIALSGMWGWPKPVPSHSSAWPALWLVMNLAGLVLAIVGVIGLAALFAATTARRWAFTALVAMLGGTVFFAPVLGLVAVARPAVANVAGHIGADSAANLEDQFFRGPLGMWLAVAGLLLIGVGWIALGLAVLSCRVLNRTDGYLLMVAVALAVAGAYLSWQFLVVLGSLVALAAGMDLSWSAAQLRPDGSQPDDGH